MECSNWNGNTRNLTTFGCCQSRFRSFIGIGVWKNSSIISCDGKSSSTNAFLRICSSDLILNRCSLKFQNILKLKKNSAELKTYFHKLASHPVDDLHWPQPLLACFWMRPLCPQLTQIILSSTFNSSDVYLLLFARHDFTLQLYQRINREKNQTELLMHEPFNNLLLGIHCE